MSDKYKGKIKIVIKFFPLTSHLFSRKAAQAALAAHKQERFWEFHEKLLENYKTISDDKIFQIAQELNLDMDRFKADRNLPDIQALINRDIRNGREIGVTGTPTIFINGKEAGLESFTEFINLIESELKKNSK